jgi:hypothetical protein
MKTQVLMQRSLFGREIKQQSKTGFFDGKQLEDAGNLYRLSNNLKKVNLSEWLRNKSTIEFINELELSIGHPCKIGTKGRNGTTWLHPYLFIDFALHINPKLKIEVYGWLYDELLKYRNDSGDSYKKMTGALYNNTKSKSTFQKYIIKVADKIRGSLGVDNWQSATEEQLKLRDKIHENISLLCDVLNDNDLAVNLAIKKTLENE